MAAMPAGSRSVATPPGTMRSIIRRWPKPVSAARRTCSRRMPVWACISAKAASLQTAPMSLMWLARRSSSAMTARSQWARGRGLDAEGGFGGAGEGERIGHGAVAGDPAGEPGRGREVGPGQRPSMPLWT
jgi:hypothetical protein